MSWYVLELSSLSLSIFCGSKGRRLQLRHLSICWWILRVVLSLAMNVPEERSLERRPTDGFLCYDRDGREDDWRSARRPFTVYHLFHLSFDRQTSQQKNRRKESLMSYTFLSFGQRPRKVISSSYNPQILDDRFVYKSFSKPIILKTVDQAIGQMVRHVRFSCDNRLIKRWKTRLSQERTYHWVETVAGRY